MIIREHARRGEGNDPHRCDCEQKRTERVACRMRVPIERTKDQNRPDGQKKRTYPDQSEPHIRSQPRAAGTMHVVHDDATEQEIRPGQAYVIDPGHDAWVVGDEAVVGFEFDSRTAKEYAKG